MSTVCIKENLQFTFNVWKNDFFLFKSPKTFILLWTEFPVFVRSILCGEIKNAAQL